MSVNIHVSQRLLRRIGARAVHVVERHREQPAIGHFMTTLPPLVAKHADQYDRATVLTAARAQSSPVFRELEVSIQSWSGPLRRDLSHVDFGDLVVGMNTPQDVVSVVERIVSLILAEQASGNASLPYAPELLQSLEPRLEKAKEELALAQGRQVDAQQALAEARETAVLLHRELVAFRRTLRAVLGSTHRDYQLIRASRNDNDAEEPATAADAAE